MYVLHTHAMYVLHCIRTWHNVLSGDQPLTIPYTVAGHFRWVNFRYQALKVYFRGLIFVRYKP